ncbi:hypothetical protein [Pasteurella multocida]|uniref:hypothetical protein n=1 Tax=Pasteurella TaxID=745 RepID=UPI000B62F8F6|nr:hypothetical protein [Pasteurella multocida]MBF6985961.1 hypothetical protein [Pasteurella multocida]MDA5607596.1 hypothetical protein [Pasteurella multocida subsp. multocida]MDA5615204.1 hypothetical protein [Pasteurella multocida]MDA5625123.1 hypothetical protein [Pasteurella multocida]OWZ82150.1 hypothetical protein CDE51_04605 [Pasteurella multocida]
MSYIGAMPSAYRTKQAVLEDIVATMDLLDLAKERLIENDLQESSRLLRIAVSDMQKQERIIKLLNQEQK